MTQDQDQPSTSSVLITYNPATVAENGKQKEKNTGEHRQQSSTDSCKVNHELDNPSVLYPSQSQDGRHPLHRGKGVGHPSYAPMGPCGVFLVNT
jgi:hypothetical protein